MEKLSTLLTLLATLQASVAEVLAIGADAQALLDAAKLEGYNQAKAEVSLPTPEVPVEPTVPATADEKDQKIAELQQQMDELKMSIDASIATATAQAVADFKAQLKAKYEEQQVAETATETGFGDLLV